MQVAYRYQSLSIYRFTSSILDPPMLLNRITCCWCGAASTAGVRCYKVQDDKTEGKQRDSLHRLHDEG